MGRRDRAAALTNPSRLRGLLLAVVALTTARAVAASQDVQSPVPPGAGRDPSAFQFVPEASAALRVLWNRSSAEKREYVACMGGTVESGSVTVERVLVLEPDGADSLGVSAQNSIDTCGPPLYSGTVHTHIALIDGTRPYARFSGADRGVMLMWWRRWNVDGMFCVLYSERDAYCELDGSSILNMGRSAY